MAALTINGTVVLTPVFFHIYYPGRIYNVLKPGRNQVYIIA